MQLLHGCNALVVFLGNFGPETPETLIKKFFDGPCMFVAAAEETGKDLVDGRGDAYCGMLNCSYNLGLRKLKGFIPEYPVGTADDIAKMIAEFMPVAAYRKHAGDPRIKDIIADMEKELGSRGNTYPDLLERMAQFELTLTDWAEQHKGAREYVVFADKCWPAFPEEFGFEPCYVNSRLASRGMPVACEVDIFGALSEYIGACVTEDAVTLLDINNSVPQDLYDEDIKTSFPKYKLTDTFMGFHCGNTPFCKLTDNTCCNMQLGKINYQIIQHRLLEPKDSQPDFTRGTLEGDLTAGPVTFFRLQTTPDTKLQAYVAEGEVLPVGTRSFGSIGIFAIPEMGRFYRHVLIEKRYPHHGAVAFKHVGKALFDIFRMLGIETINYNQPAGVLYPTENPFA